MAPLFAPVAFADGSPLAAEAARIRAAASDPLARAALALESVQGNVRYLFNGLDHGNYVAAAAREDVDDPVGRLQGEDAAAAVAARRRSTFPPSRCSPTSTSATSCPRGCRRRARSTTSSWPRRSAGRTYWLDGTGLGTRPADLGDTPNFRYVLPLRAGGADLMPVATQANARPDFIVEIDRDQSAGLGLPVPTSLAVTLRGPLVETLKAADKQLSGDKRKAMIDKLVNSANLPMVVVSRRIDFDGAAGTATIRVTALTNGTWAREDQHYQDEFAGAVGELKFDGDRGRPEWRAIPVATPGIQSRLLRTEVRLPDHGRGFVLEGDRTLPPTLAGATVIRHVALVDGVVTVDDRLDQTAAEIAPGDIAATRAALALARTRTFKMSAPRDYPPHWRVVRDARAAGRLAPIEAAFASAIADATEKPPLLAERAAFRAGVFDRAGAIADLTTVIATRPTVPVLLTRARLLRATAKDAAALADSKAAYDLDPGSPNALGAYAGMLARTGRQAAALALLDEAIAAGGERKSVLLSAKADLLARDHQTDAALAAIDAAIAAKPGDAGLLNSRCWLKGTLGVQLDTALKDCTKALELGVDSGMALDSRAMVFLKMGRLDDARTDIDAALIERPDQAGSLFLRGVIEARQGGKTASADDLTGARMEEPRIDEEYQRYGVKA